MSMERRALRLQSAGLDDAEYQLHRRLDSYPIDIVHLAVERLAAKHEVLLDKDGWMALGMHSSIVTVETDEMKDLRSILTFYEMEWECIRLTHPKLDHRADRERLDNLMKEAHDNADIRGQRFNESIARLQMYDTLTLIAAINRCGASEFEELYMDIISEPYTDGGPVLALRDRSPINSLPDLEDATIEDSELSELDEFSVHDSISEPRLSVVSTMSSIRSTPQLQRRGSSPRLQHFTASPPVLTHSPVGTAQALRPSAFTTVRPQFGQPPPVVRPRMIHYPMNVPGGAPLGRPGSTPTVRVNMNQAANRSESTPPAIHSAAVTSARRASQTRQVASGSSHGSESPPPTGADRSPTPDEEVCGICQYHGPFDFRSPCQHNFHTVCIRRSARYARNNGRPLRCPICRTDIVGVEPAAPSPAPAADAGPRVIMCQHCGDYPSDVTMRCCQAHTCSVCRRNYAQWQRDEGRPMTCQACHQRDVQMDPPPRADSPAHLPRVSPVPYNANLPPTPPVQRRLSRAESDASSVHSVQQRPLVHRPAASDSPVQQQRAPRHMRYSSADSTNLPPPTHSPTPRHMRYSSADSTNLPPPTHSPTPSSRASSPGLTVLPSQSISSLAPRTPSPAPPRHSVDSRSSSPDYFHQDVNPHRRTRSPAFSSLSLSSVANSIHSTEDYYRDNSHCTAAAHPERCLYEKRPVVHHQEKHLGAVEGAVDPRRYHAGTAVEVRPGSAGNFAGKPKGNATTKASPSLGTPGRMHPLTVKGGGHDHGGGGGHGSHHH